MHGHLSSHETWRKDTLSNGAFEQEASEAQVVNCDLHAKGMI